MTDIPPDAPALPDGAPQTDAAPAIRVLAQFVRDLSFENPNAPDSLRGGTQPQIDLSVEMNARGRPDGLFEVDLKLGATATREGENGAASQIAFQVELLYGGLFEVANIPDEHLEPVLLAECPRLLFPFARRLIADCTAEGGFAPFLLEPIDFATVYAAQRAQREAAMAAPPAGNA
jgi:preprotein translocase subunit SecB